MYEAPWLPFERIGTLNWLILATGAIGFLVFWCLDYRRWGALSFASYLFGFQYFLKVVVLFPFAWSDNNIVSTGQFFGRILEHLDLIDLLDRHRLAVEHRLVPLERGHTLRRVERDLRLVVGQLLAAKGPEHRREVV